MSSIIYIVSGIIYNWWRTMIKLTNNLRRLRFEHDQMSQDALAKLLEVSRQTVNAIENGRFNPSVKLALKMAKVFNCRVEDIFYLEEDE